MCQTRVVFHWRVFQSRNPKHNLSHLCYAGQTHPQCQVAVKLPGSFRLTAGNRHLHRYCIFTERVPETVLQSLHHSCASELTRQGISLFYTSQKDHVLFLSPSCKRNHGVWPLVWAVLWTNLYITVKLGSCACVRFDLFSKNNTTSVLVLFGTNRFAPENLRTIQLFIIKHFSFCLNPHCRQWDRTISSNSYF